MPGLGQRARSNAEGALDNPRLAADAALEGDNCNLALRIARMTSKPLIVA